MAPCGLLKGISAFVDTPIRFDGYPEVVECLAVLGLGMVRSRAADGGVESLFGLSVHPALKVEDAQCDVRAVIARVAPQPG